MKYLLYLVVVITSIPTYAQLEIPHSSKPCQIIKHKYYTLCYDEEHEQAAWVAYSLTSSEVNGKAKLVEDYQEDPKVTTGSAQIEDYAGSGYVMGQLAPASHMNINPEVMSESFYMSNVSPQVPGFNQGVWKKLEERLHAQARFHASSGTNYYIVTGPLLHDGLPTIGSNEVSVPEYYYKVVYNPEMQRQYAGMAFLMKNEPSSLDPTDTSFMVSIDSIEAITGLDFFPDLNDERENSIESNSDFLRYPVGITTSMEVKITKCQFTTLFGNYCERSAEPGTLYCPNHKYLFIRLVNYMVEWKILYILLALLIVGTIIIFVKRSKRMNDG